MTEVIKVNNIYKSYKIYFDKSPTLKEKVLFRNRTRYAHHEALKGVSLSINKGEVVGLIGTNGSGKSTLLKILTRIIYPNSGTIEIIGKVSSLLELGAGFHPDMTGRENIYMNASIFGLTKGEVDERLDRIIAFSGLGEYIDNPVRTYSSGMYMRLAFSVAINVDADILLVDEILAVGDAAFQSKCFRKMEEIKNSGTTIVIVSHDLNSIQSLCNRVFWIQQGVIAAEGKPKAVINQYLSYLESLEQNKELTSNEITDFTLGKIEISKEHDSVKNYDVCKIRTEITRNSNSWDDFYAILIAVVRNDGLLCFRDIMRVQNLENSVKKLLSISLYLNSLLPGDYRVELLSIAKTEKRISNIKRCAFSIKDVTDEMGVCHMEFVWNLKEMKS